jgi:hypothetical protein
MEELGMSASVQYCRECNKYHRSKLDCPFERAAFGAPGDGYDGPARMVPRQADRDVAAAMAVAEAMDRVSADMADPDANIKNPGHYSQYKIEPITFIEENNIPYSEGNVIKYICRWRKKDGVRDLKKAREYIDLMIAREEK